MTLFKQVMNLKFLILALILLMNMSVANSQTKTFDLNAAIDYALKNNRDIKIAVLEVNKAHAAVSEAYGYALPTLDMSASLSHFLEKSKMPFPSFGAMLNNATYGVLFKENIIPEDKNKFLPMDMELQSFALSNNYETKFSLTQVLFNSAVFTGIGSAGTYLKTSQILLKNQISKSVVNVQKAFYTALLTKEMKSVIEQSYKTFEATVNNVEKLYNQGMVSEFDYLQLKVQLENFKPKVIEAENAHRMTVDALKLALSMDKAEEIDVAGTYEGKTFDIPEIESAVSNGLLNNLDIMSLEYKKKVDEAFVDIDKSEFYPTLAAFANASFSGASDSFDFQNYRSSMIGLSFTINLFNGFKTDRKVEQKLIEVEKTNEQLSTIKDGIAISIKSKILDLRRLNENIKSTEDNVKLSERAYQLAEIRLKEGTGTQIDLLNAESAKREAILNKYKAITDALSAKFDLDNLMGILNPEYLKNYENKLN
ncbi:MAG TPA: TolC family protein [Candidatus Kapabacteria bacterium]|nr:TolC family protein [Candidatus Kapabacteria bacterium]